MNHKATTARLLTANPDKVAPVSGCRCRECGRNAHRDDPETIWFLECGAAYCQPCAKELFDSIQPTLTDDDKRALGSLCTRDEAGQHFTAIHSDEWLAKMESAGYIAINRPIHGSTGMPYAPEYWSVEVAEEVSDWFDSHGNLYTD